MLTLTNQLKKINNFCIELNRIYPTSLMNIVVIDPPTFEQIEILCSWFKIVLCVKKWDDNEFEYFSECMNITKNILLMNDNPLEVADKFNEKFVDIVLINSNIKELYYKWQDKIYHNGFICGVNKNKIPSFIKADKKYKSGFWLARKE